MNLAKTSFGGAFVQRAVSGVIAMLALAVPIANAQDVASSAPVMRESLADAWWTGPMLANSAGTLPQGHFLIEPYFYDVAGTNSNSYGSLTYMLYGVTDKFTAGIVPTGGFNTVSGGLSSAGMGLGDVSLLGQYGLTQFHPGSWVPSTAIEVEETLPTGRYDRLGDRPSDGFGSGAYSTLVALNTQTYFWMPNGRILRMRFNVSRTFSSEATVDDASVYGTTGGFRGHAKPGGASFVDAAWEYSLTKKWVLALDATYRHAGNTRVTGYDLLDPNNLENPTNIFINLGSSDAFGLAPAIEYNFRPSLGVLLGTRVIAGGHNTSVTVTPALAINYVH